MWICEGDIDIYNTVAMATFKLENLFLVILKQITCLECHELNTHMSINGS